MRTWLLSWMTFVLKFLACTRTISLLNGEDLKTYWYRISQDVVGFFDGVPQDGLCPAQVHILLNEAHSFRLKLNYGRGTNTKDELLALWCLYKVSLTFGLYAINIFVDSLIIINWENTIWNLRAISRWLVLENKKYTFRFA